MKNKKVILLITLLISTFCLGAGTFAFFSRSVEGTLTGNVGNLFLVVNEADSLLSESFNIRLRRSETEDYIFPDDSGSFEINIDSTGSISDVEVTVTIERTNLPENLRFYTDVLHTEEFTSGTYTIRKADTMIKSLTLYWFWDGSIDDVNDTLFMNKTIEAKVNVSVRGLETNSSSLYNTLLAKNPTLDYNIDFGAGVSSFKVGEGLMMMNTTQSKEYPILYYRGDVTDNNVVFGGFCWLIVRTTETGGTKLVYNGTVNSNGSCNNYSGVGGQTAKSCLNTCDAHIGEKYFCTGGYLGGYMHNSTTYDLSTTSGISKYKSYLNDNSIDTTTGRHTQNKDNSNAKSAVDYWYKSNILGKTYETLLEDTVWCFDRSVTSKTYSLNKLSSTGTVCFSPYTRIEETIPVTPSLTCSREIDRFTVDRANGNGDLDYPIGMLTADEIIMAGNISGGEDDVITTYLTFPEYVYWLLSPDCNSGAYGLKYGRLQAGSGIGSNLPGIRPAISLGKSAKVISGNGSFSKPYKIS